MKTITATASATYSKLRDGSWGIRVPGSASPGQAVCVVKRSGESKTETVGRVLWTDGSVSLCAIGASSSRTSYRSGRGTWTGCSCGSRTNDAGDLIPARGNCASCEHDA